MSIFVMSLDPDQPAQELAYNLHCQCDAIRVTKTVRPFNMVCCAVNENSAALIVSDGRVMLWELKSSLLGPKPHYRYILSSMPFKEYF